MTSQILNLYLNFVVTTAKLKTSGLLSLFYYLKVMLICSRILWFLQDVDIMQDALKFYRLMVVWLVSLIGGFKMPLPTPCPMEFASMPEHFIEDSLELLLFASRIPRALDGFVLVSVERTLS